MAPEVRRPRAAAIACGCHPLESMAPEVRRSRAAAIARGCNPLCPGAGAVYGVVPAAVELAAKVLGHAGIELAVNAA